MMSFLKTTTLVPGHISETQNLNIKMKDFIEWDEPTSCLKLTLEQQANVQPGSGIPELHLVLELQPPFLKWIFTWLWKKTVYVWTTKMAFMAKLLIIQTKRKRRRWRDKRE
ncbi:hypothetical protein K1719_007930 [Acacia pycnantha]|nr:hypothetical protein K1719_007930 [Acacia pycnantha]